MPFTSTSSPEYGCSWPPPPWSSPPGPRSRPRRRRLRGLPTSPPSPCDWLFWLLRLFWFWLFWFWLLRLFWPCPEPGRFRVCCWPDGAPCPFCADPLFSLPSASSGGSTKMAGPVAPGAASSIAVSGGGSGLADASASTSSLASAEASAVADALTRGRRVGLVPLVPLL